MEATTVTGPAKNLIRFCRRVNADKDAGLTVSIAAFHRPLPGETAASSNPFFEAVRAAGIELDILPERGRFDRSVIASLSSIIQSRGAGIIQTHAVKSHFLIRYSGLHRRLPWLAFHHGYTAEDLKMRLYVQLDRWSLRAAHRVVTVCGPFSEALVRTGVKRERIHIVPNSVESRPPPNENEVRALRQRLGIPDGVKTILSVGRFSSEKGQSDLLAALRLLAQSHPQFSVRVVLVGEGIDRPRLERIVASSGLTDRVIFAGHQQNVGPFFRLADLFVLPSHSEGSPNVLLEAMAAGLPIVATAVGGVPETVEHESSALLIPARQPGALANAIARVLESPALAGTLAANASARVAAHFSPEGHSTALLRVYRAIAPDPAGVALVGQA